MIHYADFAEETTTPPPEPQFDIEWVDKGKTAQHPANPAYPIGIVLVDPTMKEGDSVCGVDLPYPAGGVGVWKLTCKKCGRAVACTAAGRADDPRQMVVKCKNQPPP